tara:strand:+ start:320 stop:556 length:237 start_codon:yes stop_codon:yes gene_type:complete
MPFYTYIIQSQKNNKFYTGQTQNISKRIERHNTGKVKSTKSGIPWKLINYFEFKTRKEAVVKERQIKNRGVKRFLLDL